MNEVGRESIIDFSQLIEQSLDAIMVLNSDSYIVYVNQACIRLLGGKCSNEIVGKYLYNFLHSDFHDICKGRLKSVLKDSALAPLMEQQLICLDGSVVDIEVLSAPFIHNDVMMTQAIIRDITEKKQIEKLIQQSEKLSLIGEIASGIVHEIRNPLTSIKGFLQLMKADDNYYAGIVLSEVEQIEEITNDLLFLSKPKKNELLKENLFTIIDEVVLFFSSEAFKRNVQIHVNSNDKNVIVVGDKRELKQVFLNLLKNGIEAIDKREGYINIDIKKEIDKAIVTVEDNGVGISKDDLHKIGQSYFTSKAKGTGLGLMVTQNIIKSHKGKIAVKSEKGKGTVFTITLPLDTTI